MQFSPPTTLGFQRIRFEKNIAWAVFFCGDYIGGDGEIVDGLLQRKRFAMTGEGKADLQ